MRFRVKRPFDMEADGNDKYWIRQIDVKDRFKRDKVIHDIATDLGIGEKFPLVQANTVTEKIKDDIKKKIAFPPEYLKMKHPPRPHVPQCDVTKLLDHKTTILSYSLSQFRSTSIKLDGLFNDGGRINIRTTTSAEDVEQGNYNNNIKLNLTLFAQSDDLFKHVSVAQIENHDSTSKTVHINSHHHLGSCLVYNLDIIFPSTLASYKDFNLIANHATKISGDLNSIVFKKFRVGVGRGAIDLKDVKSEEIMVGTLNGIVLGSYQPTQKLGIAAVEGATMVEILPRSKNLKSTVVTLNGPVKAIISDGLSKSSRFITHCWFCQPSVESKNPEQVHVTSSRRKMIKIGYFNQTSNAHINVHSRHGESKLVYN
ncbi:uncharacterized protein EV154DRAFT_526596 [Mucor mucedo]|uniref:uncharacterized protein n=1 Tax=Mucor mucedo TaxID=29922 RepID=UPI0022211548|nr:uncharacterized protein EV154DRAFT_526596 [Mucor mucedo]KAI7875540.1 hypothetical protein EV154DRAFT_526596 [Mucor mucedo]